jgi:hypothetical protein
LGSAQNEREESGAARGNLLRALQLNPQGAGYRFAEADQAFAAALDAFLRAGVMEPRYARAGTYTAVACGRRFHSMCPRKWWPAWSSAPT